MTEKLADLIGNTLLDSKALSIVILDFKGIENAICAKFIVCHGTSNTHVNSIAQNVEKEISEVLNEQPFKKEGFKNGEWILLDYGDIVVHVFQEQTREFYNIEELWGDAQVKELVEE